MPSKKKFLDRNGVKYLWKIIKLHFDKKADKEELIKFKKEVNNLEFIDGPIELYGGSASDNI